MRSVHKRRLVGTVVSSKMDKTVVVRVNRVKVHPIYRKRYTVSRNYKAHDETNALHEGDAVTIEASRPISKDKKWRVVTKNL